MSVPVLTVSKIATALNHVKQVEELPLINWTTIIKTSQFKDRLTGLIDRLREKYKQQDDQPSINVPMATTAAGLGGINIAANRLRNRFRVPNIDKVEQRLDDFVNLSRTAPSAEFPYLYSRYGHQLMQTPVTVSGRPVPVVYALSSGRKSIANAVSAPKKVFRILAKRSPVFKRQFGNIYDKLHLFHKDMITAATDPHRLKHYMDFTRSPLDAYGRMLAESAEGIGARPVGDVLDNIIHAYTKTPQGTSAISNRAAALNKLLVEQGELAVKNKADFTKLFSYLHDAIPEKTARDPVLLRKHLTAHGGLFSKILTNSSGKPRSLLSAVSEFLGFNPNAEYSWQTSKIKTLEQLQKSPYFLQHYLDPIMGSGFKKAPVIYNRYMKPVIWLNRLGGKRLGITAAALGLGALYPYALKKMEKKSQAGDVDYSDIAAGGVGAASLLAAINDVRLHGLGRYNPFSSPRVAVLGGLRRWNKNVIPGASDSFTSQSHALINALKQYGVKRIAHFRPYTNNQDMELTRDGLRVFDSDRFYVPSNIKRLNKYDAVVQVGASPQDVNLANANRWGQLRYRALTDYGPGNLPQNQPVSWLGGENWMRVNDLDPNTAYTRFIVPGGDKIRVPKSFRGRKANINTNTIPTSGIFAITPFVDKGVGFVPGRPVDASLTIGGGAGGFTLFEDAAMHNNGITTYDLNKKNIIDDIVTAMRRKHGNNFKLTLATGGADVVPTVWDRATGAVRKAPGNEALANFLTEIKRAALDVTHPMHNRFKNVNIVGKIPQSELAKLYARSHYLFQIPGSTTAELMSMPGTSIGKVINLVPDWRKPWMPKHFIFNHFMVKKHMPGARGVNAMSPNRARWLSKFINEYTPQQVARIPLRVNYANVVNTISRDVFFNKLKNLGRLGILSAPAALALSFLIRRNRSRAD